jgi:hypothetical protein
MRARGTSPLVALAALAAVAALPARAEPYLAIRTGLNCDACHVNRTGGGERTAYGASYGATTLPWKKLLGDSKLFDGAVGDRVRIGADGRGGYVGHLPESGPYLGEILISEANLYLGADLIPDRLKFYVDEHVAPGGASSREAFAMYSTRWHGFYAKGGKIFLPFGLRLQDDDAATRRGTGFTFSTSDLGLEVGASGERWMTAASVSNGTAGAAEQDNRKQYVATAAWIHPLGRIGASISNNALPAGARRTVAGVFGGFHADRLVVLTEIDRTQEVDAGGAQRKGAAGHVEADLAVPAAVTLRAWTGAYDLDTSDAEPRFAQWGIGTDWTPLPGLQLRVFYRARSGPASAAGSGDDEVSAEVHVYF